MALNGASFVLCNVPDQQRVKKCITDNGGKVVFGLNKQTSYMITTPEEVSKKSMKIRDAQKFRVPIISKDYIFAKASNPDTSVNPYILVSAATESSSSSSMQQELTGEWRMRSMKVFVSSTFLDMRREREVLTQEVFPFIRRYCHERHVLFSYVDLRWGIPSEDVAGGRTISLCLDEVDACRPYFIGILGQRYGWSLNTATPEACEVLRQSFEYAQVKRPWLARFTDRSVTELEIIYSLGSNSENEFASKSGNRSCFYFRDPKYIEGLPDHEQANHRSESDEAATKLRTLKETIKKSHVTLTENYTSQEELKKQLIADLIQRVDRDFPTYSLEHMDPETLATFSFAQSLVSHFPPQTSPPSAHLVTSYVSSKNSKPLVIVGDSGTGKSTLLAHYLLKLFETKPEEEKPDFNPPSSAAVPIPTTPIDTSSSPVSTPTKSSPYSSKYSTSPSKYSSAFTRSSPSASSPLASSSPPKFGSYYKNLSSSPTRKIGRSAEGLGQEEPQRTPTKPIASRPTDEVVVIPHFVGCYPTSTNRYEILRKIMLTLQKKLQISLPIPTTDEDLVLDFPLWVTVAAKRGSVVLLLDGIDWLDTEPGETPHQALEWLPHKFNKNFKVVITVSPSAAPRGAKGGRRGPTYLDELETRGWDTVDLSPLTADSKKTFTEGYLAQFGKKLSPRQLDQIIRAPQTNAPVFLKGVLDELQIYSHFDDVDQHLESCLEADSAQDLFHRIISKWESDFPETKQLLMSIYSAPRGMSEEEIVAVTQIPQERWDKIRPLVFEFFVRTPYWTFASPHLRECVKERYFNTNTTSSEDALIHSAFVKYYDSKPASLRKVEAYPYHLSHAQELEKLKAFLLDLDHFTLMNNSEASKKLLHQYWRDTKAPNKFIVDQYLNRLQQYKWAQPPVEELASRMRKLGNFFTELSMYDNAILLFDEVVSLDKRIYGVVHTKVAEDLQHQANVNIKIAKYDMAESIGEQVLELYTKVYGRDNIKCAEIITLLAMIYKKQAEYEKAESMYAKALQINENHWRSLNAGSDIHSSTSSAESSDSWTSANGKISDISFESFKIAVILNNLADVRRKLGQFAEAFELYEKALSIVEITRGSEHTEVAEISRNIGLVLKKRAEYDKAEGYYTRAMDIIATNYGVSHVLYGQYMYDLGDLKRKQDLYDEAQALYTASKTILEVALGPEHPEIAEILNSSGLAKKKVGKYDEAANDYMRAMEIVEKCFGKEHPKVGMYLNNLADCYRKLSKYDVCEPLYARALVITEATYGPDHPEIAEVLNNMGLVAKKRGLYDQAEPLYKRALAIITKHFGSDHPKIGMYLTNLGDIYRKKEAYKVALSNYERALTILSASLGEGHSEVAEVLHSMGLVHMQLNNFPRSQTLLNSAIKSVEAELGSSHPKVGMYLNSLGESKLKELIAKSEPKAESGQSGPAPRATPRQYIVSYSNPTPSNVPDQKQKQEEEDRLARREVEETLKHALDITTGALGGDHIEVADILGNIGLFHLKLSKQYLQAWGGFTGASNIVAKVFGTSHPKYAAFVHKLSQVLEAAGPGFSKTQADLPKLPTPTSSTIDPTSSTTPMRTLSVHATPFVPSPPPPPHPPPPTSYGYSRNTQVAPPPPPPPPPVPYGYSPMGGNQATPAPRVIQVAPPAPYPPPPPLPYGYGMGGIQVAPYPPPPPAPVTQVAPRVIQVSSAPPPPPLPSRNVPVPPPPPLPPRY